MELFGALEAMDKGFPLISLLATLLASVLSEFMKVSLFVKLVYFLVIAE